MKIDILTLFPEMFGSLKESIVGRASKNGLLDINIINIRDFSKDKHQKCDDEPYGGGAGMLMSVQPIYDAIKSVLTEDAKLFYLSPKGKVFNQEYAIKLSQEKHIILLCGHYEGVDHRILEIFNPCLISVGDYVLTGGEIPAMALIDSILRYVPDVLGNSQSTVDESFSNGLLEYPQYTRPQEFLGNAVPEVLLSGNHANIDKWRYEKSLEITRKNRPDLLEEK